MRASEEEERELRSYARAVETRFRQLGGSARLVSPREFALLLDWFERRIPLQVVTGALEEAFEGSEGISSLTYLKRPVDRLFRVYREARMGAPSAGEAATVTRGELRDYLREALSALRREAGRPGPGAEALEEVASGLELLLEGVAEGDAGEGAPELETVEAEGDPEAQADARTRFREALADDLNAPRAMAVVWEVARSDLLAPADPLDDTLLQEAQQLGLQ